MVAAGSQWVQQVCSNIGACKPMGMVASTLQEKTECGACRAVAMDIEYLLDRERDYKDKKRMKALVGTICDDLGMRHPQSDKAFIEVGRSRATTAALPSVDRAVLLWFHRTTAMKSWRRLASVRCGCGPGDGCLVLTAVAVLASLCGDLQAILPGRSNCARGWRPACSN